MAVLAACSLLGLLEGCCSVPPPPAAKFFNRDTPEDTLKGFVYAVDAHQWAYAYESLAESSRQEYGQLRVEVVIRFLAEPNTGIALFDLISNALELRTPPSYYAQGLRAEILVVTRGRDDTGRLVFFQASLYFVKEKAADGEIEGEEWHLDLLRSLGVDPS